MCVRVPCPPPARELTKRCAFGWEDMALLPDPHFPPVTRALLGMTVTRGVAAPLPSELEEHEPAGGRGVGTVQPGGRKDACSRRPLLLPRREPSPRRPRTRRASDGPGAAACGRLCCFC